MSHFNKTLLPGRATRAWVLLLISYKSGCTMSNLQ